MSSIIDQTRARLASASRHHLARTKEMRRKSHGVPVRALDAVLAMIVAGWILAESYFEVRPIYAPSSVNIALFCACVVLLRFVRVRLAFYVGSFWLVWFIIGSLSMIAANMLRQQHYYLDVSSPNNFYLISTAVFILGLITINVLTSADNFRGIAKKTKRNNPIIIVVLGIIPLLYLFSVYQGTGDLPLLSGRVLSEAMYEVGYGFFHRFNIILMISALMLFYGILYSPSKSYLPNPLAMFLIGIVLIIAMIDGRRAVTLYSIFAMALMYLESIRYRRQYFTLLLLVFSGLATYIIVEEVRSLGTVAEVFDAWYGPFWAVGVEYRDYVLTFVNFRPEDLQLAGYDWLGSTTASVTPSPLATITGMDKDALVVRDSARTLMAMFGINLGIRIGIVGEVWFAYQFFGLIIIFLFGMFAGWCAQLGARAQSPLTKSILIGMLSIFALSVMGQSTVTFGTLPTLGYLYVLSLLLDVRLKFR